MKYYTKIILVLFILTACGGDISSTNTINQTSQDKLRVVSTTSIVYDIVKSIGGDSIDLDLLLPMGVDPHGFEPAPKDMSKLSNADILFINGAGLESFINKIIESSGGDFRTVDLSEGVQLINAPENNVSHEESSSGSVDPHIWMDPNNVMIWAKNISKNLSDLDPENAGKYQLNAQQYISDLENLDIWIKNQVEQIPSHRRKLIVDHLVLGYFAKAYGFDQVGAVLPTYSDLSQPSAQEIAALEEIIRKEGIKAILVGISENPYLAQRIAEDTGVNLVSIYTETMTGSDGPADNYIDLIRYDVEVIIKALH